MITLQHFSVISNDKHTPTTIGIHFVIIRWAYYIFLFLYLTQIFCPQALGIETEDDIHLLSGYFVKELEKEKEESRKASVASGAEKPEGQVSGGAGWVGVEKDLICDSLTQRKWM